MKMRAIVQEGYGSPDALKLREIEKPAATERSVLVKVAAASVNAADWHLVRTLPRIVGLLMTGSGKKAKGSDLAGTVESVGAGVVRFKPGDEVFGTAEGTFAEYVIASEDRLAPRPRNLTLEQAAALPLAGVTALQGLRDAARLQPGQRALVYGAGGGVGMFAVQIARSMGAQVTAVSSPGNLELLRSIGADEVIDYTKEDFTRSGRRYDVLLDIGANRSFADCRRVLAPGARHVLVGAPRKLRTIVWRLLKAMVLSRVGSRRPVWLLGRSRQEDLLALKNLAEAGNLSPVIDRRYPLSEVPKAVRQVGTGQVRGKVVITVLSS